jgi:hypothetical protein
MAIVTPQVPVGTPQPSFPQQSAVQGVPAQSKQSDTTEAPKPAETTAPKADAMDPKMAAMARKERAYRQQVRAQQESFKAKEQALAAREAEIASVVGWKSKLTQDPMSVLTEAGITYDQLTNAILNQPNATDLQLRQMQAQLQALKDSQEQASLQLQQAQAEQYNQAKLQIERDVKKMVALDDTYEAVKFEKAEKAVVALIEATFQETGEVMDLDKATQEVEDYLLEEHLKRAQLKKIQAKLNPPPVQQAQKTQTPQKQQMTTLTNRSTPSSNTGLSDKDRRARAIAAFQGQKIT